MKIDVRTIFGEDEGNFWCDYQPMLEAFGNIAIQVDDNDYQGDSRVLYDSNGKIGVLQFGWGSCSGCDALQACGNFDELQELCDSLQDEIRWFEDKQQALEWFKTHDWEGDYSFNQEETNKFVKKCISYLEKRSKNQKWIDHLEGLLNAEKQKAKGYEELAKVHSAYITILLNRLGATEDNMVTVTAAEIKEAMQKYEARAVPSDGSWGLYCEVIK